MDIQVIKAGAGKVIEVFTAKGLKPYVMKEHDLKADYVANKAGIDLKVAEIIVSAWKQTAKEESSFDKVFGGALMSAIAKTIEPPKVETKSVGVLDDEPEKETLSSNGEELTFEEKVRGQIVREAMHKGLTISKGVLEGKVKGACKALQQGYLKNDRVAITRWAQTQVDRLDVQAIVLEILQSRGYKVQAYLKGNDEIKPSTSDFIGNEDFLALCRSVGDCEGDPEKKAASMANFYGFEKAEKKADPAPKATASADILG